MEVESSLNFGQKIKNAREDLDMTQSDMANLIPMNQSNYSKIERNLQEPNMEQLKRICIILRLDPRQLLDIDGVDYVDRNDVKLLADIKALIKKYSKP